MPSLFRATIGLMQRQWTWHRENPGRLSRVAQEAVDRHLAIEALLESVVDRASEEAAQAFWDRYHLEGNYAIENERVARHEATDEQMAADALALGAPADQLMDLLDTLYDIEREAALRRAILFK
jgi:hypothetical protein